MAWVVTNQTSASSTAGATLALTIPTTIAAGSLVVVGVSDLSNASSGGSMTDSQGNTYTPIVAAAHNATPASGFSQVFYSVLATGLIGASDTITYTKQTSGSKAILAALSATGNSTTPLDSAVTASATGTGAGATVTSGTPSVAGELFVGWYGSLIVVKSRAPTADTTHGWTSPPLAAVASGISAGDLAGVGGEQVNAGVGTIIHAPSPITTTGQDWANFIVGFKPPTVANNLRLLLLMGCGT